MAPRPPLERLLAPRHIAVVGGDAAAGAIRQCRRTGFSGPIWPVNPQRASIEGLACYPDVSALPEAPDASFVAVPNHATVGVVRELAGRGAGGAVCHASGFAELDGRGSSLQRDLARAAGDMAVLGPNCLGLLNYLDGVALWPDEHGGRRVDSGVVVITQSGNIGQNLTMQRRSLPLAQLVTTGNTAVTGIPEIVQALLHDERITAIGLHLEGMDDTAGLLRAGLAALRARVPIVALKTGTSELGASVNASHTSSLAGSDTLADAFFARTGIARVHSLGAFLETLKFLHVHGPLTGSTVASASCSGGEAALVADLAQRSGVAVPPFEPAVTDDLRRVLGEHVAVSNPLDYHTYIWGSARQQTDCFRAFLSAGLDCHLLVLDMPRADRCAQSAWQTTVDAYMTAHRRTPATAAVVSTLPEGLPESLGQRLLVEGIAPMQGLEDCLAALRAAHRIGEAQRHAGDAAVPTLTIPQPPAVVEQLDEPAGKRVLERAGLDVPAGTTATAADACAAARGIGFPVVVKAVSAATTHKSEAGAVHLGLTDEAEVRAAVSAMPATTFLVERMVPDVVVELMVGVRRDPQYGLALTIAAGGVLVDLLRDSRSLLLPVTRSDIETALGRLRVWRLMAGFRGRPRSDVSAAVDAIAAITDYASDPANDVVEVEVNPLLVLPEGRGAVAGDVLLRRGSAERDRATLTRSVR